MAEKFSVEIICKGPRGSGKTLFLKALQNALDASSGFKMSEEKVEYFETTEKVSFNVTVDFRVIQ